jgi:predicted nucleotide-binding protein (sugar kinase/HSP70/actin superfamily)
MNLKCSAGTGSLMDTLSVMFGFADVATACAEAYAAPRSVAINATCAVFLMENARKLQLQGMPRDEILASANWAIVENMARTLWNQLELPPNCVVLLHGQTMLSEPLPIAVTHRLQSYLGTPSYALVPPNPGHRACFGLIKTLNAVVPDGSVRMDTARLVEARFDKRIVQCRGAVCEDKAACCNRSCLTCRDSEGRKTVSFTIGGCSAINELQARKKDRTATAPTRDTGKELWDFIAGRQPHSDDPGRVVIPRSFAVSEWSYLFARFLERLGIPVHVDDVRPSDLTDGQPLFNVDTCAPQIGAVGQYRRLAGEPHGAILALQIERLPTAGTSTGHTCTVNQGGVGVAMNLARLAHPDARFLLAAVDVSTLTPEALGVQFGRGLRPLFERYGAVPGAHALREAAAAAIDDHARLRAEAADLAATMMEEAREQGTPVAVVVGREYVLNPGIYDSHVRRLLRDKHMVVVPSWVLDLELNPDYAHIYWRNPHFIVSVLDAISRRELHRVLRHPGLREAFRAIELGPQLLPVVQVSTFSCGPDSIVQPFIAEIMRQRPFLLIQSDAVIKELAHLENRVNTYVRQLELGLHQRLRGSAAAPFEIRTLDDLVNHDRIDRETDVIYFPTLADNRPLTAILRGAGYTCFDNYDERTYDLQRAVRAGRRTTGDAPCAPLAAVYADLEAAVRDFARRQEEGDPQMAGKRRLLYFDNKGPGPCRQGQYVDVHRALFDRARRHGSAEAGAARCPSRQSLDAVRFLVGVESTGYDIGLEQWVVARTFQAAVLQGVLQTLYFSGGTRCRDDAEFERFEADFRGLKARLHRSLEQWHGPGEATKALVRGLDRVPGAGTLAKYFAYRLSGREFVGPLRRFAHKWIDRRGPGGRPFRVAVSGEVYMRVSQAEEIFRLLLANVGFGRVDVDCAPLWSYLEYTLEESIDIERDRMATLQAAGRTAGADPAMAEARSRSRTARMLQAVLRHLVARPLYRAAGLRMPVTAGTAMRTTRELLPTLRPRSEIAAYVGEAIGELRHGVDLLLNVGPNGCMVASMGEALTPAITHAAQAKGRVQHLFSADGDVNEELLTLAVLKAMGPHRYYGLEPVAAVGSRTAAVEPMRDPEPAMAA